MTSLSALALPPSAVEVEFIGDSTLHRFSGTAMASEIAEVSAPGNRTLIRVVIPVSTMNTGHESRDNNMRHMLDAAHYGLIVGEALREELLQARAGETIALALTIRNETRQVEAVWSRMDEANGEYTVVLECDISLKDYLLKAPSVMGLIRVKDTVHLSIKVMGIKEPS
ncbi:MAG TPA: YceI family protein [Kiritimatiellia bacterium]|nr:YceI family protein [Kiritimatiellia bacterium]